MAVSNAARAEVQATRCAKASEANKRRGRAEGKHAAEAESVKRQAWPTAGGWVLVSWCDPDNAWRHGSRRRRLRRAATAVGATTTTATTTAAATTAANAVATDATTASSTPRLRSNNGRLHLLWWGRLLG